MVAITILMSLGFIFGITSSHFQQDGLVITFLVVHLALALVIFLLRVLMDEQVCFLISSLLKFKFSEKAKKIWKNLPLVLTNVKTNFFQIVWPSHNILTLSSLFLLCPSLLHLSLDQQFRITFYIYIFDSRKHTTHVLIFKDIPT